MFSQEDQPHYDLLDDHFITTKMDRDSLAKKAKVFIFKLGTFHILIEFKDFPKR
jgi:hypothetical protein